MNEVIKNEWLNEWMFKCWGFTWMKRMKEWMNVSLTECHLNEWEFKWMKDKTNESLNEWRIKWIKV